MNFFFYSIMKVSVVILLLLLNFSGTGQIKVSQPDKSQIPASAKFTGELKQAAQWTDKTGTHLVILAETGTTPSKNARDESYLDAALYAYHFLINGDSSRLTWKVYDFIKECPVDLDLYFVKDGFTITDLDNNGKAEVWLMYKNSCHGDVGPTPMKIIMYEDGKKYAVRGTTRVEISTGEFAGGDYNFDSAFKNSPKPFRSYAEKLWSAHKKETWQQ